MRDAAESCQIWWWMQLIRVQWTIARIINFFFPIAEIDYARCRRVIERIQRYGVPPDQEDKRPLYFEPWLTGMVFFIAVAINHQTTPHVGPKLYGRVDGKERRGWDYLLDKLFEAAEDDEELFTVPRLMRFTAGDLNRILYDPTDPEAGHIKEPEMRAKLIRDIARAIQRFGWKTILDANNREWADSYLIRPDGRGLLQTIPKMFAYSDPVLKKIFYFLAIMRNEGIWVYRDDWHLGSPINYNEERGQFRLGTVIIRWRGLREKVRRREDLGKLGWLYDFAIRSIVHEAVLHMARELRITPPQLHYYLWYFFRHDCGRDDPHCFGCGSNCKLPQRYKIGQGELCIFGGVEPPCSSAERLLHEGGFSKEAMLTELRLDSTIWQ